MKKLLVMGLLALGVVGCEGGGATTEYLVICHRIQNLAPTKVDTTIVRGMKPSRDADGNCAWYLEVDSLAHSKYHQ